jgi:hypothetical protein
MNIMTKVIQNSTTKVLATYKNIGSFTIKVILKILIKNMAEDTRRNPSIIEIILKKFSNQVTIDTTLKNENKAIPRVTPNKDKRFITTHNSDNKTIIKLTDIIVKQVMIKVMIKVITDK